MAKRKEYSRKAKVMGHFQSIALIEICNDVGRPISAGEFARETGVVRNTARKTLDMLVGIGYAEAMKIKRGDVIKRLYCPVGFVIQVTDAETETDDNADY